MRYTYVCDRCGQMVLAAAVADRDQQHCPRCGLELARLFDAPQISIPDRFCKNDDIDVLPRTPGEIATAKREGFEPKGSRWV